MRRGKFDPDLSAPAARGPAPLGPCPVCLRPMLDDGFSTDKHHFVPRSRGGRATERVHRVCHSFIHSQWTTKELEEELSDPQAVREAPQSRAFLAWVAKKDPQYVDRSRRSNDRGRRAEAAR